MEAYKIWQEAMLEQGVATEEWDNLEESDKKAWETVEEYYERKHYERKLDVFRLKR